MPTPPFTWSVLVDWDGLNGFTDADANISAYVQAIEITLGINDPMTGMANVGTCTLTLDNSERKFSANVVGSIVYGKLLPNRAILVTVQQAGQTWTLFRGYIRRLETASARGPLATRFHSTPTATLVAEDGLSVLQNTRLSLPLQQNKDAGYLIRMITSTVFGGWTAYSQIQFLRNPLNSEWVQVNDARYTFQTALTPSVAGQVLIGATPHDSADNLIAAINGAPGMGTRYTANTPRPTSIRALVPASYFTAVQTDKPLRYYRLGEAVGPIAYDVGANTQHGTMTGATIVPGQPGALSTDPDKAIYFNGVTGWINIPPLDISNRSFSIEMWIKPDTVSPPATAGLFDMFQAAAALKCWRLLIFNNATIQVNNFAANSPSVAVTAGAWNHLIVSYEHSSGTLTIFVNGVAQASTMAVAPMNVVATGGALAGTSGGGVPYKGVLDEVAVYWTALSATQAAAHWNARGGYPGATLNAVAVGAWANGLPVTTNAPSTFLVSALADGADAGVTAYDAGTLPFEVGADRWKSDETDALAAVRECVESEYGMFWQARDGTLTFRNRNYLQTRVAAAPALSLSSEHIELDGAYTLEDVYNRVEVSYTPRSILSIGAVAKANGVITVPGQSGTQKWTGTAVQPGGGSTSVKLRYTDPVSGREMAVQSVVLPLTPGSDYVASDASDGVSGADYTYYDGLIPSVVVNAGEAEVTFQNRALGPLYVANFRLRGIGIVAYDEQTVRRSDAVSEGRYGARDLSISLPLATNQFFAESLAEYLLSQYAQPKHRIYSVTIPGASPINGVHLWSLNIGDVLSISDYQSGITNAKYVITGMEYALGIGGKAQTTWHVRLLDNAPAGVLDDPVYGLLDSTMRLGI